MVVGKVTVMATWAAAITVWVIVLGLTIGALVGLPGWSTDDAANAVAGMALGALLTIGLQTTTAFVAGAGRGYIAPLGWAVATIVASPDPRRARLGQLVSVVGAGDPRGRRRSGCRAGVARRRPARDRGRNCRPRWSRSRGGSARIRAAEITRRAAPRSTPRSARQHGRVRASW